MPCCEPNPRRPPKKWWRDCVRGVEESGSAVDPESVCGALWYRKMSESQRRAATRRSEKRLLANQNEGETMLIAGGVIALIGLLLWRAGKKKAPATTMQVSPPTLRPIPVQARSPVQGPYSFVPGGRR